MEVEHVRAVKSGACVIKIFQSPESREKYGVDKVGLPSEGGTTKYREGLAVGADRRCRYVYRY